MLHSGEPISPRWCSAQQARSVGPGGRARGLAPVVGRVKGVCDGDLELLWVHESRDGVIPFRSSRDS